ncbi:hypothetical protein [Acutalibacter caecimuris]|uniref:hypothetical protein n=1 Tax=Acutalibacter caecimuris TaxID=3093657 RepID=UPI002AC9266A|nr:hypothetical protein [Acutalibacter sp. M00118]
MADREGKHGFSPPALGGSSLLVVFAVLSLTVFALLSLSTVRADQRLGDASAKAVSDYYAADAQAQEILARLRLGEVPAGVAETAEGYAYACPISGTQALQVELRANAGNVEILRWQVISTVEWEGSDDMVVWDGEEGVD